MPTVLNRAYRALTACLSADPPCPDCLAEGLSPCNRRIVGEDCHGEDDTETDEPVSPEEAGYEDTLPAGPPPSVGRPAWNRLPDLHSPLGFRARSTGSPARAGGFTLPTSPTESDIEDSRGAFFAWARVKDEDAPRGASPRLVRVSPEIAEIAQAAKRARRN
jgi:hypothetical protein